MEILASLLFKLAPYVIGLVGLLGAYFAIKHQGVLQERAKWEAKQAKAVEDRAIKLGQATALDADIDKQVQEQIDAQNEAIKKRNQITGTKPGDKFTF